MSILRDESGKFKKGNSGFWLGKKRLDISGSKNPRWSGGMVKRICLVCKSEFKFGFKKRIHTSKFCSHQCRAKWYFTGEKNPRWDGGIKREKRDVSVEYRNWRSEVYERDRWKCRICGHNGRNIVAHHIKTWKAFPDSRFIVENGITLCRKCHCKIHSIHRRVTDFKEILRDYTLNSERR